MVVAGDGQVSFGRHGHQDPTRVRSAPCGKDKVIAGFAGATADAMTLFERLEGKLEQYPTQLDARLCGACQGLAHRPLFAPAGGHDDRGRPRSVSLVLTGTGDVLEPEHGVIGIGSGGQLMPWPRRAR